MSDSVVEQVAEVAAVAEEVADVKLEEVVVKEEAAEEKIIAIIDTLPNTTPVSTSAQPQENIIR